MKPKGYVLIFQAKHFLCDKNNSIKFITSCLKCMFSLTLNASIIVFDLKLLWLLSWHCYILYYILHILILWLHIMIPIGFN